MNFLILGDGPEERAWAHALAGQPGQRLWAAYPGLADFPELAPARDLDEALATAGVEAAVVGGEPEFRAEALRRTAAAGLPSICLHPPGPNADPYYQVALSREETGALVVPDLPLRLHPGLDALSRALEAGELGQFRGLTLERAVDPGLGGRDLAAEELPRDVDAFRALLGEIESVTATGSPPGPSPTEALSVVLRAAKLRGGEIRLSVAPASQGPGPARLTALGTEGSLTLEYDPGFEGPSRLVRPAPGRGGAVVTSLELPAWDRHAAILASLADAMAGRAAHPDLLDGTRAVELAEASARSLRRGRTVDLHYEEVSEAGNFKTVMTSLGCLLLIAILVVLPLALAGPALGFPASIYLAWAIPPVLVLFLVLQTLRLAMKRPGPEANNSEGQGSADSHANHDG